MAKVLYGGGVANMSGSEAGTVHSHNKGGTYTRQRTVPTNPQTVAQILQRDRVSQLAKQWGAFLDQNQRTAWNDFAVQFPVIDTLGQSIFLSGLQMFIKLNNRVLGVSAPILESPPANLDVAQLTFISGVYNTTLATFDIQFLPLVTTGNVFLQIEATPALSPGITFVKNRLRFIDLSGDAGVSPSAQFTNWTDKYGIPAPVGTKIVIRVRILNADNGAISVPLRDDVIAI